MLSLRSLFFYGSGRVTVLVACSRLAGVRSRASFFDIGSYAADFFDVEAVVSSMFGRQYSLN